MRVYTIVCDYSIPMICHGLPNSLPHLFMNLSLTHLVFETICLTIRYTSDNPYLSELIEMLSKLTACGTMSATQRVSADRHLTTALAIVLLCYAHLRSLHWTLSLKYIS